MWDANERYCESKARTHKLRCSDCERRILKGERVVFLLDTSTDRDTMKKVFCPKCGEEYTYDVADDSRHIFDLED
jgi:predicted RNA-binding Zn-ribbon protein involved in translation (DUF1610 family)